MRQDYFTRFAQQLLAMHAQNADSIAWSDVHDWLADAPKNASNPDMEVWTELMCLAIENGTRTSMNNPQLVASLWRISRPIVDVFGFRTCGDYNT